jgi:hypothetical protein
VGDQVIVAVEDEKFSNLFLIPISESGQLEGLTVSGNLSVTGNVTAANLLGNGSSLTSLNASNLASGTVPAARLTGAYTGITGLGTIAGTLTVGSLNVTALTHSSSTAESLKSVGAGAGFTFESRQGSASGYNTWYRFNNDAYLWNSTTGANVMSVSSAGVIGCNGVTATTFSGSGASLTSLNASNLASGSVPAARLNSIGYTFLPFAISAQGGAEGAEVTWTGGSGYSNWQQDVNVNQMRFFTGGTVHMSIAETGALSVRSSVSAPTMSVSSTDGFAFSNGGGKLWMQDTTWVRTDKSFYNGGSVLANDGHLSIGYGGATDGTYRARVNGNMNIASNTLIGGALFVAYAGSVTDNGNGSIRASANASCTGVTVYSTAGSSNFDPFLAFYDQTNGTNAVGSVSSPANSSTTTYFTTSDYRLKRDVLPLTDSLRRIMLLRPVTFKWKNISSSRTEEGFLAHEVAAVVPTAVSGHKDEVDENGEPVVQQMELARLVPVLIGAVQELAHRLEQLEQ